MKKVSFVQALKDYIKIYMPSRNFAPRTRIEYTNDLEDLIQFLKDIGVKTVNQVNRKHMERYLAELDRRGYTGSTRRRKFSSARSLFTFLHRDSYIVNNITQQLTPPRMEHKQPRVLTETEYKRLLRACSHDIRDAAIIEFLLQTGIRLSELTRLTIRDVELPARIKKILKLLDLFAYK